MNEFLTYSKNHAFSEKLAIILKICSIFPQESAASRDFKKAMAFLVFYQKILWPQSLAMLIITFYIVLMFLLENVMI